MRRRRLIAALLLAAMIVLAGCGSAGKKKTVIDLGEAHAHSESVPAESAAAEEKLAECWYGWWVMSDGTDSWKKASGCWWDCCARVTEGKDGKLSLSIWDEDVHGETRLAELSARRSGDRISAISGKFMGFKLSDCSVTVAEDGGVPLLTISGSVSDKATGSFSYSLRLRPWGERWPDSKDELPYHYDSWYLPLIEKSAPMPNKIG